MADDSRLLAAELGGTPGLNIAAWAAVLGSWDCATCCRPSSYVCPVRHSGAYREADAKWASASIRSTRPFIFQAEDIGICPMAFFTDRVRSMMQMRRWFDTGQLGVTYMEAPEWFVDALSVLSAAVSEAREFVRATKTPPAKG